MAMALKGFPQGGAPGDRARDGEVPHPLTCELLGVQGKSPIPGIKSGHQRKESGEDGIREFRQHPQEVSRVRGKRY